MGRQQHGMDRPGKREQRKIEKNGSEISYCAPATLVVKELMMMMMMMNHARGLHFHCRFDDLGLFQGQGSARNKNCKVCFFNSCLDSCLL